MDLLTPFSQGTHLLSVGRLIVVGDQAYHRCVVGKFDNDVGAVCCCTVVCVKELESTSGILCLLHRICYGAPSNSRLVVVGGEMAILLCANCSVFGCTDKDRTLFRVPASEETREQWIY